MSSFYNRFGTFEKWNVVDEKIEQQLQETTVADHRKLKDKLLELVEKSRDPIVLVWLGTCELTEKKGKYISIRHYNYKYQNVEYKLDEYRELLSKIKEANPTATVIFLECPYHSIYAYNSRNNIVNRTSKDNNNNTTIVKTKGRSLQVTKRKQYPVLIINKYRKSSGY